MATEAMYSPYSKMPAYGPLRVIGLMNSIPTDGISVNTPAANDTSAPEQWRSYRKRDSALMTHKRISACCITTGYYCSHAVTTLAVFASPLLYICTQINEHQQIYSPLPASRLPCNVHGWCWNNKQHFFSQLDSKSFVSFDMLLLIQPTLQPRPGYHI